MKKIKKIDILSLGKVMGLIYALLGLAIGLFFTFFSSLISAAMTSDKSHFFRCCSALDQLSFSRFFTA